MGLVGYQKLHSDDPMLRFRKTHVIRKGVHKLVFVPQNPDLEEIICVETPRRSRFSETSENGTLLGHQRHETLVVDLFHVLPRKDNPTRKACLYYDLNIRFVFEAVGMNACHSHLKNRPTIP